MLRWAFAIYMVLVTAAGPGLCCCSLTHLFAGHAGRQTASPDLPPCCQNSSGGEHQYDQGGCPRDKRDDGKRDDGQKPGCPCRQVEAKPALIDRAVEMPDQSQAGSFLLDPSLAIAFDGYLTVIGGPAMPGGPLPFVTAHDLLHAHRQLRC